MKFYDAEGNVPLHSAVHSGDIKAVALCLKSGAVLSTQQHDLSTPVHLAASQGAIEIVKLMFASQPHEKMNCLAICDAQSFTPLHCACAFDHEELVRYLVSEVFYFVSFFFIFSKLAIFSFRVLIRVWLTKMGGLHFSYQGLGLLGSQFLRLLNLVPMCHCETSSIETFFITLSLAGETWTSSLNSFQQRFRSQWITC